MKWVRVFEAFQNEKNEPVKRWRDSTNDDAVGFSGLQLRFLAKAG
jgi:hypothetical protein